MGLLGKTYPFSNLGKEPPQEPSEQAQAWSPQKVCSLGAQSMDPAWKQLYKEAGPARNVGKALCSPLHLPRGQAGLPCRHWPRARHCKPRPCQSISGLSVVLLSQLDRPLQSPESDRSMSTETLRPEAGRIAHELRTWCSMPQAELWEWQGGGLPCLGEGTVAQEADCHWPERSLHLALSLRGCELAGRQYEQGGAGGGAL